MVKVFTRLAIFLGLALPALSQTIPIYQITPSTTNNQVITTVNGQTSWQPITTACGPACVLTAPTGSQTIVQPSGTSFTLTTPSFILNGPLTASGAITAPTITATVSVNATATTAATSSANVDSPAISWSGNYWNGTASATDTWSCNNTFGTAFVSNPTSTLSCSDTGAAAGTFSIFKVNHFVANIINSPNIVSFTNPGAQGLGVAAVSSATSSANYSSPIVSIAGGYWTGTVNATDVWTWEDVLGTGANPTSTLTLNHTGSAGGTTGPLTIDLGSYAVNTTGSLKASTLVATQSITDSGLSTVNDCVLVGTGGLLTEGACGAAAGVNYNPPNTNYEFYGDSKFIVSSSCIVSSYGEGTVTAWSITSNVLTLTAANTQSAGNVVTLAGFPTSTFLNGQTVTVLSTGLSGTQFEVNFTHANGNATESGTYACTYTWPHQFSQEPFALGHGSVINYGIAGATSATLDADYATDIHPSSPAVTGNPGFLFLHTGSNDFQAGLSLATVEANLQTLWADAHGDGWTVVQYTNIPDGGFGTAEQAGILYQVQLNQWLLGQSRTATSATGQYWDKLIDVAQPLNNPWDANMVIAVGLPDNYHLTDAGAKVAADYTNQALGVQGSQFTAINGANIFLGPQRIAFNQNTANGQMLMQDMLDTESGGGEWSTYVGKDINSLGYEYHQLNGYFASSWHMVGGNYPAFTLPSWGMIGFNGGGSGSGLGATEPPDTAITRDAAGVMDVGQGGASVVAGGTADKGGSFNLLNETSLGTTTETFCAGNAPCTNQANTFKVGTQTVSSGTSGTVAQVVQGSAFAQPAFVWTVANSTNTTWVAPSNVVAGDALVVILAFGGTNTTYTMTDTLGNTFTKESTQVVNGDQMDVWVAVNSPAGADTVTSSQGNGGHLSEFSGVATATPLDAQTSVAQTLVPNFTIGPLTTTQYDLLITVSATAQYPDPVVTPAQYTTLNAWTNPASGLDFASAYATLPAGANVATWTSAGGQAGGGILLALKAASTSGQTADLTDWKNAAGTILGSVDAAGVPVAPALRQTAASSTGGTCAMAAATSCTFTLGHTYTTPVCLVTQQSATLTGGASGCTVSGTTVTITAATANSETWGAFVFGNPN